MTQEIVLSGNLKFLSLGDIIQLLGSNGSTGVLKLNSRYAQQPGLIYFSNGNPVDASNAPLVGIEALYSFFGWVHGEFEFNETPVRRSNIIRKNKMEIILDGLRMLDDGEIEKLGPVSFEKTGAKGTVKDDRIPVIKGPLADYMYVVDEEDFSDGEEIVKEGKHGSWIWVVLEGTVEIIRDTPKGPLRLLRIGDGSFVGSVSALLIGGNVRSASAVAVGNVQLGVLDAQRLSGEFVRMLPELREILTSYDRRLKSVTDFAVDLAGGQNPYKELLKDKKLLLKQGKQDDRAFLITQGEACVIRDTDYGYVPLCVLKKGDVFGKMPFFDINQEPDSASLFVSQDIKITELDVSELQKGYLGLSQTFKNMIESMSTCVAVTSMSLCEINQKNVSGGKKQAASKKKKS